MKVQINDDLHSVYELSTEQCRSCKLLNTMMEVNDSLDDEIKLQNVKDRKLMEFAISCLTRAPNTQNVEYLRVMLQDISMCDMFDVFQGLQCTEWLEYVSTLLVETMKECDITKLKTLFDVGPYISEAEILRD